MSLSFPSFCLLLPVLWIRIRVNFGRLDPDPDKRAVISNKSEENSSFEVLDALFSWLKTSALALTSFMEA